MRALALVVVAACASKAAPPPPEEPGLEGLRAHLDAGPRVVDTWRMPEATWRAIVSDAYVDHYADYVRLLDAARPALIAALETAPKTLPKLQYVDDPALDGAQVRMRWIVPVGRPGTIADGVPAVFLHDGAAWRALVPFDDVITATLPRDCAAAYLDNDSKPCQEWSWEIGEAALRGRPVARACGNAIAHACGR